VIRAALDLLVVLATARRGLWAPATSGWSPATSC